MEHGQPLPPGSHPWKTCQVGGGHMTGLWRRFLSVVTKIEASNSIKGSVTTKLAEVLDQSQFLKLIFAYNALHALL